MTFTENYDNSVPGKTKSKAKKDRGEAYKWRKIPLTATTHEIIMTRIRVTVEKGERVTRRGEGGSTRLLLSLLNFRRPTAFQFKEGGKRRRGSRSDLKFIRVGRINGRTGSPPPPTPPPRKPQPVSLDPETKFPAILRKAIGVREREINVRVL